MGLRSSYEPRPWSWQIFPAEIRSMILQAVAIQKYQGWSSHATVCREWQHILEPFNFRKLHLRIPCLEQFACIVPKALRRRLLVRHICFDIELPRYATKCCNVRPIWTHYGWIVRQSLNDMYAILAGWKRGGDLTLELNIYSPSDSEHFFKNLYLSSDNVESGTSMELGSDVWKRGVPYHDPKHGWQNGHQLEHASEKASAALFQHINYDTGVDYIVTAVTCFTMRRQLRRCIGGVQLAILLERLRGLKSIWYEPWEPYKSDELLDRKEYHYRLLAASLNMGISQTVKNLIVFEDSYDF
ncbi:hypothetical protein PWT90_05936 [Aphanocladium album]|nr:hypothetical protein PWT90_05936 [Aphanocladium album]